MFKYLMTCTIGIWRVFTFGGFAYVQQQKSSYNFRHFPEMRKTCEEGGVNWYQLLDLNTIFLLSLFDSISSNQPFDTALCVSI